MAHATRQRRKENRARRKIAAYKQSLWAAPSDKPGESPVERKEAMARPQRWLA